MKGEDKTHQLPMTGGEARVLPSVTTSRQFEARTYVAVVGQSEPHTGELKSESHKEHRHPKLTLIVLLTNSSNIDVSWRASRIYHPNACLDRRGGSLLAGGVTKESDHNFRFCHVHCTPRSHAGECSNTRHAVTLRCSEQNTLRSAITYSIGIYYTNAQHDTRAPTIVLSG